MMQRTNLEDKLKRQRDKETDEQAFLDNIYDVLAKDDAVEENIRATLKTGSEDILSNNFDIDQLQYDNIYHLDQIKTICVNYRMRFLNSHRFKAELPYEAIQKIKRLQEQHNTQLEGFKIIAPAKCFKLENADDPLLFAPIGNGYFRLIHKWGHDLHPLRKLMMWPFKNLENFALSLLIVSFGFTALLPKNMFTKDQTTAEFVILAFFLFKCFAGIAIYYGFARGKNFSSAIWNSKFINA